MAKQLKSKWNGFSLKPKKDMPEGLWVRCPDCEQMLYKNDVEKNFNVCSQCNYHFRIDSKTRVKYLVDEGSFQEISRDLTTSDPLKFKYRDITYKQRIKDDEKKSQTK